MKVVFHFETEIEDPLPDESIEDYVWWLTDEYGHSGLSAFISDYADDESTRYYTTIDDTRVEKMSKQ